MEGFTSSHITFGSIMGTLDAATPHLRWLQPHLTSCVSPPFACALPSSVPALTCSVSYLLSHPPPPSHLARCMAFSFPAPTRFIHLCTSICRLPQFCRFWPAANFPCNRKFLQVWCFEWRESMQQGGSCSFSPKINKTVCRSSSKHAHVRKVGTRLFQEAKFALLECCLGIQGSPIPRGKTIFNQSFGPLWHR